MTSRIPRLSLVVVGMLALSACSAAVGSDETSSGTEGTIELAVSETCADAANQQCVLVNGENVVLPSVFERAGVEDAAVTEGQNAIDVTLSDDGAEILHSLTEQAVQAGDAARLVISIGGERKAAVAVMQALEGNHVQIALSPDDSAQDVVDLIHAG